MTPARRLAPGLPGWWLASSLLAAALLAGPGAARAAGEFKARGFLLPSGAVKIDDDRYRLPLNWEEALKFYRNSYPLGKFPRRLLANQTGVRALHLANPRPGEEWEGANLYEVGKGEVRVFVLGRRGQDGEEEKVDGTARKKGN